MYEKVNLEVLVGVPIYGHKGVHASTSVTVFQSSGLITVCTSFEIAVLPLSQTGRIGYEPRISRLDFCLLTGVFRDRMNLFYCVLVFSRLTGYKEESVSGQILRWDP